MKEPQPHASPIALLPVEILESIFLYTITASPYCDTWYPSSDLWNDYRLPSDIELIGDRRNWGTYVCTPCFGNSKESPWSISCVCKQWRSSVLATPQLWRFIELSYDPEKRAQAGSLRDIVKRLNLALERSRPLGIDLIIGAFYTQIDCEFNISLQWEIESALSQHADRWERVFCSHIVFSWRRVQLMQINSDEGVPIPFPRLKALTFHRMSDILPNNSPAPNLETIFRLRDFSRVGIEDARAMPLVRHYSSYIGSDFYSVSQLPRTLTMFSQMERLTTFRLGFDIPPYNCLWLEPYHDPSFCATLPAVTSLHVGVLPYQSTEQVLGTITTPALQHLYMVYLDNPRALISLLDRSECHLSSLHIKEVELTSQDILDILTHTPELRYLQLRFPRASPYFPWRSKEIGFVNDALLEYLLDPFKSICQKLCSLELLMTKGLNLSCLIDLLKMRLIPGVVSQIDRIRIEVIGQDTDDFLTAEINDLLRDLRIRCRFYVQLETSDSGYDSDNSSEDAESSAQFTDEPTSASEASLSGSEDNGPEYYETSTNRLLDLDEEEDSSNDYDHI